jgi:hypothetical protein
MRIMSLVIPKGRLSAPPGAVPDPKSDGDVIEVRQAQETGDSAADARDALAVEESRAWPVIRRRSMVTERGARSRNATRRWH